MGETSFEPIRATSLVSSRAMPPLKFYVYGGTGPFDAKGKPGIRDARRPPCGTLGGFRSHRQRFETVCDACRAAADAENARRNAIRKRERESCG
jgi:hypothetical protein